VGWMPCGACTSGSTAHRLEGTSRAAPGGSGGMNIRLSC